MAEVVFHARAANDLEEIVRYIAEHSRPEAAEGVRAHLVQRAIKLGTQSRLGVRTSHPAVRILSPSKYPYRLYFTRTAERVVVLHIRHTARELPKRLGPLLKGG